VALWERLVLAQAQGNARAREQNKEVRESGRPQVNPEKTTRTKITQRNDITIRRSSIVLDETDGELKEMMIKSTSSFGIELEVNGKQLIHKTMPELIEVSEDIGYIVAVLRDGYYRFSITNILFDHIFMRIFLDGNGTFDIYYNAEISQPLVSGTREVCRT
jgi:hypothetical protein